MNKRKTSSKKIVYKLLFFISILIFFCSLFMLLNYLKPEKKDYDKYKTSNTETTSNVSSKNSGSKTDNLPDNPRDFKTLKKDNSDVKGWIYIEDTEIDYPILQPSEDKDDLFYLDHNLNCDYEFAGSIFFQKANSSDFSDPVTVIYGHNMLNGSMFNDLLKFKNRDFFDSHDTILVYRPGHILTYKVVSSFTYDDRHIMNTFNFLSKDDLQEYIDTIKEPKSMDSNVRSDVKVTLKSNILTLSTCTDISSQRYLVQGVLVNDERTK
ncbi:MAG: class B sortase [Lachnospiraceae bacterium]|nr:class B sortase [Lachnospiraceae bacterium]